MEDNDYHFSLEELWGAYLGSLSPDRRAVIRRHMEDGCSICSQTATKILDELLAEPPEPAEEPVTDATLATVEREALEIYDLAIERAVGRALEAVGHFRKEQTKLPEALDLLTRTGAQLFGREAPVRLRGLAGVEALLQKSWEIRYEDPHEMVFQASLASAWAERLDLQRFGKGLVRDLQCRALIELGNAYRVADDLGAAQKVLDRAAQLILEGTGDDLLEARLCDVQASLHADRRFFAASCDALDVVYTVYKRRGELHLAGRALISKGVYTTYSNEMPQAEELIRRGLELIDHDREPSLVVAAVHNLLYLLVERDRFREARTLLFRYRRSYREVGGKINLLKLRGLEGRIAAGLGKLSQAETIFREVRQGFQGERLGYKAALMSLELAVVLRQMGKDAEARDVILETSDIFLSLGVHREAIAAMLVLRKACEQDMATPALLRSTIYFLTRAEETPGLTAEDFLRR